MQNEYDDRASPADQRPLVVNGKRYHNQTSMVCKVCSQPDRLMYVKQKLDDDLMLECPTCETVVPVKKSQVIMPR